MPYREGYNPVQAERALRKAQEARSTRAELKRGIASSDVDVDRLLRGNSERWERVATEMRVRDLVLAVKGIGPTTADEILEELELERETRLKTLTFARREALAALVRAAVTLDPATAPPPSPESSSASASVT